MSITRGIAAKALALACLASVIAAIIIAHQSPAAGYEPSLYESSPFPVLLLVLLGLAGGIGVVVHEVFTGRYKESRTYLAGFAAIMLAAATFMCLPTIRNYATWGSADLLAHLGFLKDTIDGGHAGQSNPYPIVHSLLAQVAAITGLSAIQIINANTALVFSIFVIGVYLLASAILPDRGQRLIVAAVAAGTMAGVSRAFMVPALPNLWSILMLPLVFYCYFKQDRLPFKLLLALVLIVYPVFHPLSSGIIIIALAVIELPKPVYKRLLERLGMGVPQWMQSRPVLWPILLEVAVFAPWVLTRPQFQSNLSGFWSQLVNLSGSPELTGATEKLGKVNVHGIGIALLLMKMYGGVLLLLLLAGVATIMLVRLLRSGDRDVGRYRLLLLSILTFLALLFYVADYVGVPGAAIVGAERVLVYVEVGCVPLVGFALWEIARRMQFGGLARVVACGLVVMVMVINLSARYDSPYVIRPNTQVTHRDWAGMTWYLQTKDPDVLSYYVVNPPDRFSQGILGVEATDPRMDLPRLAQVEDHFGYGSHSTLAEQYDGARYLSINWGDREIYQTVWRDLERWVDADFERLEADPTADRIYSNGKVDILFIGR